MEENIIGKEVSPKKKGLKIGGRNVNYSKYVWTVLGSIIAGACLDMAFEEIQFQTAMIIMIVFIIIGVGGEMIADILEKKRKRKEVEREEKNREEFLLKLEEMIQKNSQVNHQSALEKTDKILEMLNIHTFNFEEYLNFHVNHQKSLENKVSELLKVVNNMYASIVEDKKELQKKFEQIMTQSAEGRDGAKLAVAELKEELERNTQAIKESGRQIFDTGNKLLEKIELVVVENASIKGYCEDIYSGEKQIIEEIAGRSSLLSEQCTKIRIQIEREAELIRELKPILEQAEDLKCKCDELIRLENELKDKLGVSSNNKTTEISTVENEMTGSRAFLGRIHHAMNKKGGQNK